MLLCVSPCVCRLLFGLHVDNTRMPHINHIITLVT
jgi:hypothetical protein